MEKSRCEERRIIDEEQMIVTAQGILEVLRYGGPVVHSWGAEDFKVAAFRGMPALEFSVNGFIHRDTVIVAYNGGADLYEVYCDGMVEKESNDEEYGKQVDRWLSELEPDSTAAQIAAYLMHKK